MPHQLSFFNPSDYSTSQLPCDLISLTVADMKAHVTSTLGSSSFDLLHNGNVLLDGCKAIDVGIGNGAVVVIQPARSTPNASMGVSAVPPYMQQNLQQQLAARNLAQYASMPLQAQAQAQAQQMQHMNHALSQQMQQGMVAQSSTPPFPFFGVPQQVFGTPQQTFTGIGQLSSSPVQSPPHQTSASHDRHARGHSMPVGRASSAEFADRSNSAPLTAMDDQPNALTQDFCLCVVSHDGATNLIKVLRALPDPQETIDQLLPVVQKAGFASLANNPHSSKVLEALIDLSKPEQKAAMFKLACTDSVLRDFFSASSGAGGAWGSAGADILVTLMNEVGDHESVLDERGFPLVAQCIANSIGKFCTSVNGRKVLLAAIEKYGVRKCVCIYEQAVTGMVDLCTEQSGCISMQRMYDHADAAMQAAMQHKMMQSVDQLVMDPYGNYVLQHAVKGNAAFSAVMAAHVKGRLWTYASNKFSSNVIEKCMQTGPDDVRKALTKEICQPQNMDKLVHDSYGNYVVQSAIDNAPAYMIETLRAALAPLVGSSPYGYRIETKLQKRLKKGRDQAKHRNNRHGNNGHGGHGAHNQPQPQPQAVQAEMIAPAKHPQQQVRPPLSGDAALEEKMAMAFLRSLSSQVGTAAAAAAAARDPLASIDNQRNIMNALHMQGKVVKNNGVNVYKQAPISPIASPAHQEI